MVLRTVSGAWSVVLILLFVLIATPIWAAEDHADPMVRIKDVTRVDGVRENQLTGFGLVVGLQGTGDSQRTEFTNKALSNMMRRFDINVAPEDLSMRNVAAVMVTANLPAYASAGDRLDVNIASMGDARNISGGTLLLTPLLAPNDEVYAVAQGPISTGGLMEARMTYSRSAEHGNVGRIPRGAIIERSIHSEVTRDAMGRVTLRLNRPDFTTASRIVAVIDDRFGPGTAVAPDQDRILLSIPEARKDDFSRFMSEIEQLHVRPDSGARVVINERTGTVVMGHNVRISTVAVSHGTIQVEVEPPYPPPFHDGDEDVDQVELERPSEQNFILPGDVRVGELIAALQAVGATPKDIIAILQAVHAAGALYGELEIM